MTPCAAVVAVLAVAMPMYAGRLLVCAARTIRPVGKGSDCGRGYFGFRPSIFPVQKSPSHGLIFGTGARPRTVRL